VHFTGVTNQAAVCFDKTIAGLHEPLFATTGRSD
jgi:hypothetical protein